MNRGTTQRKEAITPFWHRLSEIFRYPLQRDALLTVVLLGVARLGGYVPMMGWLIDLVVTIALLRYAGEVLYRSAKGRLEAPTGLNVDDERGWDLFRTQVAMVVLMLLAGFVGTALEAPYLTLGAALLIALGTPGALISAAIDGDWLRALNPMLWLQVMLRLGGPYFLLAGLCALVAIGSANAEAALAEVMPGVVATVAIGIVANYALVATFHLMGYTVYQYHERLEFDVDAGPVAPLRAADADQAVLDQSEQLATEGDLAAAEAVLREHIRERGGTDAVRARYRKLLRLRDDRPALLADGREQINVFLARDDERRAVEMWRECRELDPTFWPSDPDQVRRLSAKAAALGLSELALKGVSGFHKAYPKHRDIPANYLLAARLMVDRFSQDAKALELLRQLQTGFPQHPLAEEINAYAKTVEALVAATPVRKPT